jgi:hypothetical protein
MTPGKELALRIVSLRLVSEATLMTTASGRSTVISSVCEASCSAGAMAGARMSTKEGGGAHVCAGMTSAKLIELKQTSKMNRTSEADRNRKLYSGCRLIALNRHQTTSVWPTIHRESRDPLTSRCSVRKMKRPASRRSSL